MFHVLSFPKHPESLGRFRLSQIEIDELNDDVDNESLALLIIMETNLLSYNANG
jgi:hypothetical protein